MPEALDLSDGPNVVAAPLGAYLTYQVPAVDVATLGGLDLGPLVDAARLPVPAPGSVALEDGRVRLRYARDVTL